MDINGVPHKINRHVFKAVNFLGDYSNFSNIYCYVKTCTKKLKPVPQLKQTVQKSLHNLKSVGILKMDSKNKYYKLKPKFPSIKDNDNNSDGNSDLSPQSHTKKRHQIDSDEDQYDEIKNVSKRFKVSTRNLSRTRIPKKKLPKHRSHNLRNKNTGKVRKTETSSRSKASLIYKKTGKETSDSDGYISNEPNSTDKDVNNNKCETRQGKEVCYNLRSEEKEKAKGNDYDVKSIKSVSSKKTSSGDFREIANEPEEQLTDMKMKINESPNINNECQDDNMFGIIQRYNYNYLN